MSDTQMIMDELRALRLEVEELKRVQRYNPFKGTKSTSVTATDLPNIGDYAIRSDQSPEWVVMNVDGSTIRYWVTT